MCALQVWQNYMKNTVNKALYYNYAGTMCANLSINCNVPKVGNHTTSWVICGAL